MTADASDERTPTPANLNAIYSIDDRTEAYQANPPYSNAVPSVGALILVSDLVEKPGVGWQFTGQYKLSDLVRSVTGHNLAPDARFANQTIGSEGTCFIVADGQIATAAHNLCEPGSDNLFPLTNFAVVFDWMIQPDGSFDTLIDYSRIYFIHKMLAWTYQFGSPGNAQDWAICRLDRSTGGRPKLQFKWEDPVIQPFPVYGPSAGLLGFPSALPMKASVGSIVSLDSSGQTMELEIVAFTGDSGGPLIDSNGDVSGLISGGPEVEWTVGSDGFARPAYYSPQYGPFITAQTSMRLAFFQDISTDCLYDFFFIFEDGQDLENSELQISLDISDDKPSPQGFVAEKEYSVTFSGSHPDKMSWEARKIHLRFLDRFGEDDGVLASCRLYMNGGLMFSWGRTPLVLNDVEVLTIGPRWEPI